MVQFIPELDGIFNFGYFVQKILRNFSSLVLKDYFVGAFIASSRNLDNLVTIDLGLSYYFIVIRYHHSVILFSLSISFAQHKHFTDLEFNQLFTGGGKEGYFAYYY